MPEAPAARVLVVAHRTAATAALIDAVRERASRGPCAFTLLVPLLPLEESYGDEESQRMIALAVPLLEEAAGAPVTAMTGPSDALLAVERALIHGRYDEVVISTLPDRVSHWLGRDLPTKVERLGVPVTVVRAREPRAAVRPPITMGPL